VDEKALSRFVVIRTAPTDVTVALIVHHLILDGVSYARLSRRLGDAMAGPIAPDSEDAYVDLVHQVLRAEQEARARDRGYWEARIPDQFEMPSWNEQSEGSDSAGGGRLIVAAGRAGHDIRAPAAAQRRHGDANEQSCASCIIRQDP